MNASPRTGTATSPGSISAPLITAPVLEGWSHALSGKVRELYVPAGASLATAPEVLVVATDRISAYDFSLQPGIPDKGRLLTQLSLLWFDLLAPIIPHHVLSADDVPAQVHGRAVRCRGLDMIPLECVARGYLTGSGFADYTRTGAVGGHRLAPGLLDGSELPDPLFTPATKAEHGDHDENITVADARTRLGADLVDALAETTLAIYRTARDTARERGIILADTKLEFGFSRADGNLVLGDEVLTPDSSRFWDAASYAPGRPQPSFDKQFVRDWLTRESGWSQSSGEAPPALPLSVVERTRAKYIEAFERLSGTRF
ncbi:MAG: phosphoribosylaminoimidazolesuccinocarboxamide synthase [Dermabacter sp.]|nr:phosphoribosylaminoimidazolesuccinocarboxamide synthase [Dermabacter sp.]